MGHKSALKVLQQDPDSTCYTHLVPCTAHLQQTPNCQRGQSWRPLAECSNGNVDKYAVQERWLHVSDTKVSGGIKSSQFQDGELTTVKHTRVATVKAVHMVA